MKIANRSHVETIYHSESKLGFGVLFIVILSAILLLDLEYAVGAGNWGITRK